MTLMAAAPVQSSTYRLRPAPTPTIKRQPETQIPDWQPKG